MSFDNSDPVAMLQLLEPGTESRAFIVVCSTAEESPAVDIDLGISLQSMALKAVEIGLNALILLAFDRRELLPSGPETAILT